MGGCLCAKGVPHAKALNWGKEGGPRILTHRCTDASSFPSRPHAAVPGHMRAGEPSGTATNDHHHTPHRTASGPYLERGRRHRFLLLHPQIQAPPRPPLQ